MAAKGDLGTVSYGRVWTGQGRALKGAALALLVEEGETYGYLLASRLAQVLGPAWKVEPKQVYPLLDQLESAGLVTRQNRPAGPRQQRTWYVATEHAPAALAEWRRTAVRKEPMRAELQAKIAFSSREDGPELLALLEAYEAECLSLVEVNEDELPRPANRWRALVRKIGRDAIDMHLQAELDWIVAARLRLTEDLAADR